MGNNEKKRTEMKRLSGSRERNREEKAVEQQRRVRSSMRE